MQKYMVYYRDELYFYLEATDVDDFEAQLAKLIGILPGYAAVKREDLIVELL